MAAVETVLTQNVCINMVSEMWRHNNENQYQKIIGIIGISTKCVIFSRKYANKMSAISHRDINSFQIMLLNLPVPEPRAQSKDIWSGW
jgi:hypothetical protein